MFERAVISDRQRFRGIDIGQLAELLVYYDRVQVACTASDLVVLAERVGLETFVELLKLGHLSVVVDELEAHFQKENDRIYTFVPTGNLALPEMVSGMFRVIHQRSPTLERRRQVDELITLTEFPSDYDSIERILSLTAAAAMDWLATTNAALELLFALSGEADIYRESGGAPFFRVTNLSGSPGSPVPIRVRIETNIAYLNNEKHYDKRAILRLACRLLRNVSDASTLGADMILSDQFSRLLSEPFSRTLIRAPVRDDVRLFEEVTLGNAPAIATAIRSGHRSYPELLRLLEKKQKFTNWMKDRNPERRLIDEYFEAIRNEGWLSRLPGKITRYSFFTGGGLLLDLMGTGGIGTAAGVSASAIDAFLIDPLTRGWRPDHFVEDDLKKFVSRDG